MDLNNLEKHYIMSDLEDDNLVDAPPLVQRRQKTENPSPSNSLVSH